MHLHHVFPGEDTLHQNIAKIIEEAHKDKALQIQYLSFFFEFSFLTQFATKYHVLKKYAELDAKSFGQACWDNFILPISPRFGQGDKVLCKRITSFVLFTITP